MMLSSILDIGSFFIGMIINLLLVTLMCYYFKKKYESLEEAQNEQAKLLYELLRERNHSKQEVHAKATIPEMDESDDESMESEMDEFDISPIVDPSDVKIVDLESHTAPTTSVEILNIEKSIEIVDVVDIVDVQETEAETEIIIEENTNTSEDGFSKMNMKQLRDLLMEKGIKVKPNMKKNELVELAKL
jgi:hypothetical protein